LKIFAAALLGGANNQQSDPRQDRSTDLAQPDANETRFAEHRSKNGGAFGAKELQWG
jgi:hypothetical protein